MANVEHSVLTGSDLHESKGVAAAAANRVYVTNGAGSGSFQQVPAAAIASAGVLVFQGQKVHMRDERSSGTNGGVLSLSTWNTRSLQTKKQDDLTITLSGNQFTLLAGTYWVEAISTTWVRNHGGTGADSSSKTQLRLRNITDSTTQLFGLGGWQYHLMGGSGGPQFPFESNQYNIVRGQFTLAGSKTFELQTWVVQQNGENSPLEGKAISSGENEVYLDVIIWKLS